jgi:hypothetical protein
MGTLRSKFCTPDDTSARYFNCMDVCFAHVLFSLVQFSGGSHGFPMHVESMFGDPRCICVAFEAKSAKFSASQPVRCG